MLPLKLRLLSAILTAAVVMCSGCSLTKDPQSYMRLPRLPEDKESLKQLIQNALPPGASLVRPKKSRALGSIYVNDLNRDGVQEAVVFYQSADNAKGLTGMLWQQDGDSWKQLEQFQGEGYELDTLLFEDVTLDGNLDMLAGYSGGPKVSKGLVVYRFNGQNFSKEMETPYAEFIVDDLNQDNSKDLSVLTLERHVDSRLTVYQYARGGFQPVDTVVLDANVNGYASAKAGWIADGIRGIALDAGVGAHSASTQLVYFDQGHLTKAFPDHDVPLKPRQAINGDFNGDGIMEIGIDREPKGWEQEAMATMPWITAFYRWDGRQGFSTSPLYEWYMDIANGFYFEIPGAWNGDYTLERPKDEGVIRFTLAGGVSGVEWKTMPEETWNAMQPTADWMEIGRTAKTVTALLLTEESRKYTGSFRPLSGLEK
ncbi:hypothetical protein [Paenibacillus piri]|uniref:VCBS repeat-containing protein n=1 Tax=Paenibacillus piri TaxID=2547395 RepID=A0A4R5KM12_9BACL|nr:hypothetical protein [Paenibacillus piri]TDF95908.1 hypothetical protein E1757_19500 [Paenibacillus piri]